MPRRREVPEATIGQHADGTGAAPERVATEEPRPGTKAMVLVVDDEPELVKVTRRFLGAAGIQTVGCSNGVDALSLLANDQFDVIISDISMPNMGGFDLVRAVRSIDQEIPVIMVTGGPSVESAVQAIECGVYRYLTKPVPPQRLIEVTQRAIQLRRLARAKDTTLEELGGTKGLQSDRIGLESAFRSALNSLWPAFQPIVSKTGPLFGYEALLRTDEPSLPNPGAVLDAAERLLQQPRLFRAMRDRACEILHAGEHQWTLFLNLLPMDLNDIGLLDPNSLAHRYAKHIVLEITERTTLERVTDIRMRLARLREVGYRIAIDDLGAGYAGLTSFAALEPEFVKFDMALVRDIDKSPVKQRLMRVMTDLCHDMGLHVVAEGIETIEEQETVLELGCDLLQGYLVGAPAREIRATTAG